MMLGSSDPPSFSQKESGGAKEEVEDGDEEEEEEDVGARVCCEWLDVTSCFVSFKCASKNGENESLKGSQFIILRLSLLFRSTRQ